MSNKNTLKEAAIRDIKSRVLTLKLPPAHPLDEALLCESYQLSRTPMREVLQRLAGEGYISLEANRGAFVSSMDLTTMRNFFQTAPMVYAAIARLATEHATSDQIDALKDIQRAFKKAVGSRQVVEMSTFNHRFHEHIGTMSASTYLAPSLERLLIDHTRMAHRFYDTRQPASSPRIEKASQQHDEMIDAIENRQPARAVELTVAHWELSRSEINKYVLPDSLPLDGIDWLAGE